MIETMRWFGPDDPVKLKDIRQSGASGVVTALHDVPLDEPWTVDGVAARRAMIEEAGLEWSVVESIPVAEEVKAGSPGSERHVETWLKSLRAVAANGIKTVCYNFSLSVDWVRTDINHVLPNGATTLRFDGTVFAAFDLFVLKRPNAESDYTQERYVAAKSAFERMSSDEIEALTTTIVAGLPGSMIGAVDLDTFRGKIASYSVLTDAEILENLIAFQSVVVPEAEALGVNLAIHPNDPPLNLFGLPTAASKPEDFSAMFGANPSLTNGLTWCLGALSVGDPAKAMEIGRTHADRVHFAHLRVVEKDPGDPLSFQEAEHLQGELSLVEALYMLLEEEKRREKAGRSDRIAFRPDHGHRLADDLGRTTNPGYSFYGRMKGLAELRGAIAGLSYERPTANRCTEGEA